MVLWLPGIVSPGPALAAATTYPTTPPAQICGNASVLNGPAVQPPGSVRLDTNQNIELATLAAPPGTTFWLATGVHTLGLVPFSQVMPKNDNVYVGAPGAVIDGQGINRAAFTQRASGVTIRHLTIRGFDSPLNEGVVNHDSGLNWTIEYNTIAGNAGAGVMLGTNTVVRSNCLADNGQYGFSAYSAGGGSNVTLDRNEITGNNTGDWETRSPGCGCSGAGKFWDTRGAVVTNNWVHDNKGVGLWVDTNNFGFRIEGNYIEGNDDEGIFYETSYNALIVNNTLKRNALVKGRAFAAQGQNMPVGAIYMSESGGDARVNGGVYATTEIAGNYLEDNWGGIELWENADRFCGSPANTSFGFCTLGGVATVSTCIAGVINSDPFLSDCRWKTKNVWVHHNELRFSRANVGCTTNFCGQQALFSNWGTFPTWSPYHARVVQDAITWSQNNYFFENAYVGDWRFVPYETANFQTFARWQSTYGQDLGSTFVPGNALDPDTAELESSVGQWVPWFSTSVSSSNAQAHTGTRSLRVDVIAPHGWGVQLRNWPGFAAAAGPQSIGFWAKTTSGTGLSATMNVRWRNAAGTDIRTDVLNLPLGSTWTQASAVVTAPAGTVTVGVDFSNGAGGTGAAIYIDDVVVAPRPGAAPPPALNVLDSDTAGAEASVGQWVAWFSANISSSTAQAHTGTRSLRVDVTAPHGWGAQLRNWPGFATTAGPKTIAFWAKTTSGAGLSATMTVRWRNGSGVDLRTDVVTLPLSATWAQASASVTAPTGTATVGVELSHSSGVAGSAIYVDDVAVLT